MYHLQFKKAGFHFFKKWRSELDSISFKRCLTVANAVEPPILCVFADASQEAFGACAYVHQKRDDDTHAVKFVAGKSRVAAIKQLTIPRLELPAAVLASCLAKSIQEESRLQFTDVKFFTDSTITLAWIRNSSRSFKPFLFSRVGGYKVLQIQTSGITSQAKIMLLTTCREGSMLTSFMADGWMDPNSYVSQRTSGRFSRLHHPQRKTWRDARFTRWLQSQHRKLTRSSIHQCSQVGGN